jgi:hypothetical protein
VWYIDGILLQYRLIHVINENLLQSEVIEVKRISIILCTAMLFLLLALAVALSSCSRRTSGEENGIPTPQPSPGVFVTPTPRPEWISPFRYEELYTVYVYDTQAEFTSWEENGWTLELTTELAQRAGFPLDFQALTFTNLDQIPEVEWLIRSSGRAILLTGRGTISYFSEDFFMDHYGEVRDRSLDHLERYLAFNQAVHNREGVFSFPVNSLLASPGLAVLIHNEVYFRYDQEIRNADEYEQLLWWLAQQGEYEFAPGIAAPIGTASASVPEQPTASVEWRNDMNRGVMAFDLFMPAMGYTRLPAWQAYLPIEWSFNAWMAPDGKIVEWYETDAAAKALSRFTDWQAYGLMDVSRGWSEPDLGMYPTILTYLTDIRPSLPLQNAIDITQYTINIFSQPRLTVAQTYRAAAAPTADAAGVFLDFLLWLEDRDNYIWFRYGENGVHFNRDAGTELITLYPENPLRHPGVLFTNHTHDRLVYNLSLSETYPAGYQEELNKLTAFASPFTTRGAIQARNALRAINAPMLVPHYSWSQYNRYDDISPRNLTLMSELYTTLQEIHFGEYIDPGLSYNAIAALRLRAEELEIAGVFAGIANAALVR